MVLTFLGALIVGLTLGMLGSGGSAITVPLLVYLVGHDAKESIAESMAIVGLISIFAAVPYARAKLIDWRSVLYFGLPGMLGTLVGASLGGLASEALQLVVFGVVLLVAAYTMLTKSHTEDSSTQSVSPTRPPISKIALQGTAVGVVTGFVGVGGGFLIVPALVVLGKLPMRLAIGTSLAIITVQAAVGFVKYEQYLITHNSSVDGQTILIFAVLGCVGSYLGRWLNARINQRALQKTFAGFLILIGGFVILLEGSKLTHNATEGPTTNSPQVEDK